MRIVLDTNILVSALFWSGNERKVFRACVEGTHQSVTSPILLAEAERVLIEKFDYPKTDTAAFLGLVERASIVVTPDIRLDVVTDDPPTTASSSGPWSASRPHRHR